MARPQSQAVAGYFPTPPHLMASVAARVELGDPRYGDPVIFDPCAGRGEALVALATYLVDPDHDPDHDPADLRLPARARCYGIELEATRAEALTERLAPGHAHHGDALTFGFSTQPGASVLFLNPPYDHDPDHRRTEHRFLLRFTRALAPGGVLLYVVPHATLAVSAQFLACHYSHVQAYRFPTPDFDAFGQIVVVARRLADPAASNPFITRLLQGAADEPSGLPELPAPATTPPGVSEPLQITTRYASLTLHEHSLDIPALLDRAEPFADQLALLGYDRDVSDIIGKPRQVALPPRAAHIALALATGILDGRVLTPDDPSSGLPAILAKGTFSRDTTVVDERHDSKGRLTGEVLVQQPRLDVHVLDLATREFHQLALGTEPSGATAPARFNTADLMTHYGKALAALLSEQLPALHDPSDPSHQVELPKLARTPYRMQSILIQAGLKLLALGENPVLLAQVGTGKSTMALTMAAALAPEHFEATTRSLAKTGIDPSELQPVERVLILCPPHLLESWHDQITAVLPDASVRILDAASDLDQTADYYLLSRETAKLGSRVAGVKTPRCPDCAHPLPDNDPDALARRRLTCAEDLSLPDNQAARLLAELALACYSHVGTATLDAILPALTPHPAAHRRAAQLRHLRAEPTPLVHTAPLRRLYPRAMRWSTSAFSAGYFKRDEFWTAFAVACRLALLLDVVPAFTAYWREAANRRRRDPYASTPSLDERLTVLAAEQCQLQTSEAPAVERRRLLAEAVEHLLQLASWSTRPGCGAALYRLTASPRRYPLAQLIRDKYPDRFDLLFLDEAHEYATKRSAQMLAALRLMQLPGVPTIALSGSYMGGYSRSLFSTTWALSRPFREIYAFDESAVFVADYGYYKLLRTFSKGNRGRSTSTFGTHTDRSDDPESMNLRRLGEAPGVLPSFLIDHLLPSALIMHKSDLDDELPPREETPVPVHVDRSDPLDEKLLEEFHRLRRTLVSQIQDDRGTDLAGKLWGAMSELPSYLDLASEECGPFQIAYPASADGRVLATGHAFPADWRSPKERWLLATGGDELAAGRNLLIYLRHTGNADFRARLRRLLLEELGQPSTYLDPNRVKTQVRERWLDRQIDAGCRILMVHPKAVQTGLNNLTAFHTAIWYEGPEYDARVTRQANGRPHRIGQTQHVRLLYPYYENTLQKTAVDLVARKISAGLQVDGTSLSSALEAAGALSEEDRRHADAALAFGQALFRAAA